MCARTGPREYPRHRRCRTGQRPPREPRGWARPHTPDGRGAATGRCGCGRRPACRMRFAGGGGATGLAAAQPCRWQAGRGTGNRSRAPDADRDAQWRQPDPAAQRSRQSHRARRGEDLRGDRRRGSAHCGPAGSAEEAHGWRKTQRAARCEPPRAQGICARIRAGRADRCLSALRKRRTRRLRAIARRRAGGKRCDLGRDERGRSAERRRLDPQDGERGRCRDAFRRQPPHRLSLHQAPGRQFVGQSGRRLYRNLAGRSAATRDCGGPAGLYRLWRGGA